MTGICRVCGCTDWRACPEGCWWADDDLCSRCAEHPTLRGRAWHWLERHERVGAVLGLVAVVVLAGQVAIAGAR